MNKPQDQTKDTGRVQPFRITVLCNREGRGYFSAQRHFPSGKPVVLEVLPQEEDPPPPAGSPAKVNPTHIGLRSHRQLMDEPYLSVRDGGEFPAPAQADGGHHPGPALSPEIQAKLAQLLDLDLGALGDLPGRVEAMLDGLDMETLQDATHSVRQLRDTVETMQKQLHGLQLKVNTLHPGEPDPTGRMESVATIAGQVKDLQAAVDQIPARLDGFAREMQAALDLMGEATDAAPAGESAPPPAPPSGTPAPVPAGGSDKPKAASSDKPKPAGKAGK